MCCTEWMDEVSYVWAFFFFLRFSWGQNYEKIICTPSLNILTQRSKISRLMLSWLKLLVEWSKRKFTKQYRNIMTYKETYKSKTLHHVQHENKTRDDASAVCTGWRIKDAPCSSQPCISSMPRSVSPFGVQYTPSCFCESCRIWIDVLKLKVHLF